jgi:hypothetical protein
VQALDVQDAPQQGQHKTKTKFHPLFSKDGKANDVVLLHGRHPCECMVKLSYMCKVSDQDPDLDPHWFAFFECLDPDTRLIIQLKNKK